MSWFTVLYLSSLGTWPVIELGAELGAGKSQQFCIYAPTELVTGVHSTVHSLIYGFWTLELKSLSWLGGTFLAHMSLSLAHVHSLNLYLRDLGSAQWITFPLCQCEEVFI